MAILLWVLLQPGTQAASRHMVRKSLREFLKKQSIRLCSERELQQSVPDWAFWQHQGSSSSVWLNETNSISFWYETFQWHNWHSAWVIVESDLHFPRWRGEEGYESACRYNQNFLKEKDLDLLKSLEKPLADFKTWQRLFCLNCLCFSYSWEI